MLQEHAVDPRTRLLMYKLVNNGVLDSISGTISGGKESVVFHAFGGRLVVVFWNMQYIYIKHPFYDDVCVSWVYK